MASASLGPACAPVFAITRAADTASATRKRSVKRRDAGPSLRMRKPGNGLECRAEPGECRQRQREHQPGDPPELAARFACRRVEPLVGLFDASLHAVQRAARVVSDLLQPRRALSGFDSKGRRGYRVTHTVTLPSPRHEGEENASPADR